MIVKPGQCCSCGSYECGVPMPLCGRVATVDLCVSHLVAALNAGGVETTASCCGHGKMPGSVLLADGRELLILPSGYTWRTSGFTPAECCIYDDEAMVSVKG